MRLVRLVDFGITHAIWSSGTTWCGKDYQEGTNMVGEGKPECKSCLRALAGPLGPRR